MDCRHLGDRRLVGCQNKSIADLAKNAGRRAIVNVHIRAAQVTERFTNPPTARLKYTPGVGWLLESLPRDGQAKFEGHVEARRCRAFRTQFDTGEVVEGIAATANQIKNPIEPTLAARNL